MRSLLPPPPFIIPAIIMAPMGLSPPPGMPPIIELARFWSVPMSPMSELVKFCNSSSLGDSMANED